VGYQDKLHGAQIINYIYDQMQKYADGKDNKIYPKGTHLVCMPSAGDIPPGADAFHVGDYGICAMANGNEDVDGTKATDSVKGMIDHGCKKCGSNHGVTINYVKHICSDPEPLNMMELGPIC